MAQKFHTIAGYGNTTPQTMAIPGREHEMQPTPSGGVIFKAGDESLVRRFLILGTEGGTYYASEKQLTIDSAAHIRAMLASERGAECVDIIADVSTRGLSYKQDATLFSLALAFKFGTPAAQSRAEKVFNNIVRTGSHLLTFVDYLEGVGHGWGRRIKRVISNWYDRADLLYQLTKYAQRGGWSQADVLRLSKPKFGKGDLSAVLQYAVGKGISDTFPGEFRPYAEAVDCLKDGALSAKEVAGLIEARRLPREVIPTEYLQHKEVWAALTADMPLTALIRNLATLTRVGVLESLGQNSADVADKITNRDLLRKARIHPMQIFVALKTYTARYGLRGSNTWTPVSRIIDALDEAFYLTFENVEPSGKRILLAIDTSGSMRESDVGGVPGLRPTEAAAAIALVIANSEKNYEIIGFDWQGYQPSSGQEKGVYNLDISARSRLNDVKRNIERIGGGGTDCSLPFRYAMARKLMVDGFILLTDSQTWAGNAHPCQVLKTYRNELALPHTRLVTAQMTNDSGTIADPNDTQSIELVGFSPDFPRIASSFIRGDM